MAEGGDQTTLIVIVLALGCCCLVVIAGGFFAWKKGWFDNLFNKDANNENNNNGGYEADGEDGDVPLEEGGGGGSEDCPVDNECRNRDGECIKEWKHEQCCSDPEWNNKCWDKDGEGEGKCRNRKDNGKCPSGTTVWNDDGGGNDGGGNGGDGDTICGGYTIMGQSDDNGWCAWKNPPNEGAWIESAQIMKKDDNTRKCFIQGWPNQKNRCRQYEHMKVVNSKPSTSGISGGKDLHLVVLRSDEERCLDKNKGTNKLPKPYKWENNKCTEMLDLIQNGTCPPNDGWAPFDWKVGSTTMKRCKRTVEVFSPYRAPPVAANSGRYLPTGGF